MEIEKIEIYYKDGSMEQISNEERTDIKLTKKQIEWIKNTCLSDLNDFKRWDKKKEKVTTKNYRTFKEDDFSGMPHSDYQMLISLLDTSK